MQNIEIEGTPLLELLLHHSNKTQKALTKENNSFLTRNTLSQPKHTTS